MLIVIDSDRLTREEFRLMSPNVLFLGIGCHNSLFSSSPALATPRFGDRLAVLVEDANMAEGGSFQPPALEYGAT